MSVKAMACSPVEWRASLNIRANLKILEEKKKVRFDILIFAISLQTFRLQKVSISSVDFHH